MKIKFTQFFFIYGLLHSLLSFAGSDPISWQLAPTRGFPETQIANQSIVTYTFTNHLHHAAQLYFAFQISGQGISIDNEGCIKNPLLRPGYSCDLSVKFTPISTKTTTFQLIYGYHHNRIFLPVLTAKGTGTKPAYSITAAFPNFPSAIPPAAALPFTATFSNTGLLALTNCFAGDIQGGNQLSLNPSSAAQLQLTANSCGNLGQRINLAPNASCTISGTLSAPFQPGPFTLSSLISCAEASSEPSVSAIIEQPAANLTGSFSFPNPFPTSFFNNQAPFVTAKFVNNGNTVLASCHAGNSLGANQFSINPAAAATVVDNSPQPGSCGTVGNPVSLQPGESCFLYGQLTNLVDTNNINLDALVSCSGQSAPIQTPAPFNIVNAAGACTQVTVQTVLALPTNTYKYADNVLSFKVTNTCANDSVTLGSVTLAPSPGTATVSTNASYDHCSGQTLAAGASCNVTASIIPTSTGPLTISASVTPIGGTAATTSTTSTVASNQQSQHHLLFVNQCNFDVWYGIANGTGINCPGPGCLSPDPNSGASTDAYKLPAQVAGQAPSVIDLAVASYQNGAFWPRTGCQMQNGQFDCATGTCRTLPNSGTCQSTGALVQPQSPYTKFEAYLSPTAGTDGIYDVSAINGMTVPVEVKAFGPFTGNIASTVYNCSAAGALIQPASNNALGNCSWSYNPSSVISGANVNNDFYWVTPGADDNCSTSALPNLCGMAWNAGPNPADPTGKSPINRRLGSFLGFNTLVVYSAYTVRGTNNSSWGSVNLFTNYGLDLTIPSSTYGTIPNQVNFPPSTSLAYYALVSCPQITSTGSLNSCYQSPVNNNFPNCCGCVDWPNTLPAHACGFLSGGAYTAGMNNLWTTTPITTAERSYTPEQAITWIKDACPTAYSYSYDDASSSFSCTQDGATPLNTSYQVTFCPGGVSGLPTGAADGRSTPPS